MGVFLAILSHKGLAGITLGSTMLLAEVTQSQFLCTALVFSAATPLGVGLGVLISANTKSACALRASTEHARPRPAPPRPARVHDILTRSLAH